MLYLPDTIEERIDIIIGLILRNPCTCTCLVPGGILMCPFVLRSCWPVAAGLTGPLRNMLFSSKPESICDVLIKDIVEQSGRPLGSSGVDQEHSTNTAAGLKRRRDQADGMGMGMGMALGGHDGVVSPAGYGNGSDKQHGNAW